MLINKYLGSFFCLSALSFVAFTYSVVYAEEVSVVEQKAETSSPSTVERRVSVDPDTGKLVSDPEQMVREFDAQKNNSISTPNDRDGKLSVGLDKAGPLKSMQDGSMMVELNGQFDMPLRAQVGEQGELSVGHAGADHDGHQDN